MNIRRRKFLVGAGAAALAGVTFHWLPAAAAGRGLRVTATGQTLMTHDLCAVPYPGLKDVVDELARSEVVFTNLETAILTPRSGAPTRTRAMFSHSAGPAVLDCLKGMGFNLLSLANNHAWDLDTPGVLATRETVAARGFGHAGTGANLDEATAAGMLAADGASVGLVAMASGRIRDGAAATPERPGVNELRLLEDETLHPEDAARNLASIRAVAAQADLVIAYHHNHEWGDDFARTKDWARAWARACIDAGAQLFVAHGAPLLHGIERYRGRLICHNLGSLIFHSRTPPGHYPAEVWESAIVHGTFAGGRLQELELVPVVMNEMGEGDPDEDGFFATRGRPAIATGAQADRILQRMVALSASFDTRLKLREGRARLATA